MHIRPHEHLITWKEAHRFTLAIYRITTEFPASEKFSLVDQLRRSATSIPTNIAEGNAKRSTKERNRYFEIAHASLEESHYQCRLSYDLRYINLDSFNALDDHIQRISYLLTKLQTSLKKSSDSSASSVSSVTNHSPLTSPPPPAPALRARGNAP